MSAKQMSEDQEDGGLIASSFVNDIDDEVEGEDGESEASVDGGPVFGDTDGESSTETGSVSLDALAEHVESITYPNPEPYNNTDLACELSDVAELESLYSVTMTLVSGATVQVKIHPGDDSAVKVIHHNKAGQFVREDTAPDLGGAGVSAEPVFVEILEKLDSGSFPGDVVERLR